MKSLGRLLRVSLAPSAAADAVAGLVVACGGFPRDARAWWLAGASLGVYHGALALNDWADRAHDARTRPDRPIPSGAVAPGAALGLAIALIAGGIACAYLAAPICALWMLGVATLAVVYDVAGRGPLLGPLLLAACRAGNLACGAVWALDAGVAIAPAALLATPPLLYGAYVFVVSRLGRLEDGEDAAPIGTRPRRLVTIAAWLLVAVTLAPVGSVTFLRLVPLALALPAAYGLDTACDPPGPWTRGDVERAMGAALRRLLVATACTALIALPYDAGDAFLAAAAILAGYPLSFALRRAFPPS